MHDIKKILKNKNFYLEKWQTKNLDLKKEISILEKKYDEYLKNLQLEEELLRQKNELSKEIKDKNCSKDSKITKINLSKKISEKLEKIVLKRRNYFEEVRKILLNLPNIPLDSVPIGKNEDDNKILENFLENERKFDKKPHWEIIESRKLIYKEEATNITGSRFVIYGEKLSLLIMALERYLLDNNKKSGYEIIDVPVIVNEKTMYGTGQLPKFENEVYKVDNNYLIPTSEVPLTTMFAGKIIPFEKLPCKFTASTLCFRKEAGSAGKDTRGLIRLHQFKKVEIVKFSVENKEKEEFLEIVNTAKRILDDFKIPYRIIELCTGDLSFSSRKTYDLEVWMPGLNAYREISSISYIDDFQSRRNNTKYFDVNGEKKYVKTFNGSSLAIDRLVAAIIENYQNDNQEIEIPKKLHKYCNFIKI